MSSQARSETSHGAPKSIDFLRGSYALGGDTPMINSNQFLTAALAESAKGSLMKT